MTVLTFRVGGTACALPLRAVSEVCELPALRRVPLAPTGVLGLVETRGAVVAVVDLARALDPAAAPSPADRAIRLAPPFERTALAVAGRVDTGVGIVEADRVVVGGVPHRLLDGAALVRACAGR